MPTLLTSSKFFPVPVSVSVLFPAWLFFPLLWEVETLLCRITNRTVKLISAAACKDKWGDTWSNLCGSRGPSRNWHCDRWGDKWRWHNQVAWMSRGGEGGVCSPTGSPAPSAMDMLCFQDHSKIASSSLLFSRPWASSLTVALAKEAGFLWGILLSQEWQLNYLAEKALLRGKRTRAKLAFSLLLHHSSALLVQTLISLFTQPAGSQELWLPPSDPSLLLSINTCTRSFYLCIKKKHPSVSHFPRSLYGILLAAPKPYSLSLVDTSSFLRRNFIGHWLPSVEDGLQDWQLYSDSIQMLALI